MKVQVEIEDDTVVVQVLSWHYTMLKADKKNPKAAIFYTDYKKDKAEIQRHLDAFKIVLSYFGEKV